MREDVYDFSLFNNTKQIEQRESLDQSRFYRTELRNLKLRIEALREF
jgi:hypothetical protein